MGSQPSDYSEHGLVPWSHKDGKTLWHSVENTLDEDGITLREQFEVPFGCPYQLYRKKRK